MGIVAEDIAHSTLGASSASRWLACPGSVELSKLAPEPSVSLAAELGTAAHKLGELCLEENKSPRDYDGEIITTEAGNSFTVDSDMIDAVNVYVGYVNTEVVKLDELDYEYQLNIEKSFNLSWIAPKMFGTNDASIVSHEAGYIEIIDYKHGIGNVVEPEENIQGIYYALGALGVMPPPAIKTVKITIVQPRAPHPEGPVRSWTIGAKELYDKYVPILEKGAKAARRKNAKLSPSAKACQWCNAKSICPAIKDKAVETARLDFKAVPVKKDIDVKLDTLSLDDCVNVLAQAKMIEYFLDACKDRVKTHMLAGKPLNGMKYVRGNSSNKWEDPELAGNFLEALLGDEAYTKKIITPAQAIKKLGKDLVGDLIKKIPGGVNVAHNSARGKAIEYHTAENDFTKIGE